MINIKTITKRNDIQKFISSLNTPNICEVGTRNGDFFNHIFTPNCSLGIIVDIWMDTGNPYQNDNKYTQSDLNNQYCDVFKRFFEQNNIKIIREFSHVASSFFPDNFFDFIYIDADHSKQGCYQDLVHWYPKVKKGGIISGHDYISREHTIVNGHIVEFGVIEAVDDFIKNFNITSNNFHLTNEEYATYFITKQ
jgi:predicted O-methyltransferase YrrM